MRRRQNFHKPGSAGYKPRKNYMDHTEYDNTGDPRGTEGVIHAELSKKALRDLPHSSYSLKADPYTAALPGSKPYPLLNAFNPTVGANYVGDDNLDGGNVQQYASSFKSGFLSCFDVLRLKLGINYQFLPIKPRNQTNANIGKRLVDEVRKTIAESLSVLFSTTYTQMAINNFVIATDLPMGSATTEQKSSGGHAAVNVYTDKADCFYAMSMYYQLVMQDILNTLRWHNAFRLKQGTAIRNAWDREVGNLNAFFGLMNKKSFLNLVDSLNLFFEGEYVDKDFCNQAGIINYAPSRRCNAMTDPVVEIQTHFNHPTQFKIYILDSNGDLIWDAATQDYATVFKHSDLNSTVGSETKHLFDALSELNDYLSLEATTYWARTTSLTYERSSSDNARFNKIKSLIDHVVIATNSFKPKWSDFRQALDTLVRAGIVQWSKGVRPSIEPSTDAELYNNILAENILKTVLGGAKQIQFDDQTKRWRTYTMWNIYHGIPEYDVKSGGSFLSYSFKDIVAGTDSDSNLEYLPIVFDKETVGGVGGSVSCVAVCRGGQHTIGGVTYADRAVEAKITTTEVVMSTNKLMNRLVPLESQAGLVLNVPYVNWADNTELSATDRSHLYKMLLQTVGFCAINTNSSQIDYGLDPDIISVYQIEIEDTTNMSAAHARNCGPVRGTTSEAGVLGFSALARKAKA